MVLFVFPQWTATVDRAGMVRWRVVCCVHRARTAPRVSRTCVRTARAATPPPLTAAPPSQTVANVSFVAKLRPNLKKKGLFQVTWEESLRSVGRISFSFFLIFFFYNPLYDTLTLNKKMCTYVFKNSKKILNLKLTQKSVKI